MRTLFVRILEGLAMKALERLFVLEIEFQRCSRESNAEGPDRLLWELHSGYAALAAELGDVTIQQVDRFMRRMLMMGDQRDVLRARDAVALALGLRPCA
jgi:hypothetical protein